MVSQITLLQNEGISSSNDLEMNIEEALSLLNECKAGAAAEMKKQMNDLLIEYILANMNGDSTEANSIQNQIQKASQQYDQELQHANDIATKLQSMAANPGSNGSNDPTYVQNLIDTLKQDLHFGDFSNLSSL